LQRDPIGATAHGQGARTVCGQALRSSSDRAGHDFISVMTWAATERARPSRS
jgi:hypothetical protein